MTSIEERDPQPRPVTRSAPPVRSGAALWQPWTSIAALFAGLLVTVIASAFVAIVSGTAGDLKDPPAGVSLSLTLFQDLSLVGAAIAFACLVARPTARDVGLVRPARLGRAIGALFVVWGGFYAFSAVWVTALGLNETQELPDRLGADNSTVNLLAVVVLITVVAPICEELFFRGYFFGSVRNWRGPMPAAIATGVIFGAIHLGSAPVGFIVPLGFFGFGLCLLYQYSGSLYPGIALHALNNSIALGATLNWTWEIPVAMAGSVVVALTIASQLGRVLGRDRTGSAPAPAT